VGSSSKRMRELTYNKRKRDIEGRLKRKGSNFQEIKEYEGAFL
jgi:hypothetical protein